MKTIKVLCFLLLCVSSAYGVEVDRLATGNRNGLIGEYFDESNLTLSKIKQIDYKIDFSWGRGSPKHTISPDTFSARWQGQIKAKDTGVYTFRIKSDDGSRLRIGDTIIINNWSRGQTNKTGKIYLEGEKKYPIVLEYQEVGGEAGIKMYWSGKSFPEELVPTAYLFPKMEDGLLAEYCSDARGADPVMVRVDKEIDFNWKDKSPSSLVPKDGFSVTWTGKIEIPYSGTYMFSFITDGQVSMKIDNRNITPAVKKENGLNVCSYSQTFVGNRKYPIVIKYTHSAGPAEIHFDWKSSVMKRKKLLSNFLYPSERPDNTREIAVVVDADKKLGEFNHFWERGVGSGYAALYLKGDLLSHLKDVRENLGFEYVRFHGILMDDTGIYKQDPGSQNPTYDWKNVDTIYDSILSIGMRPFVEFSFMPKQLAAGDRTVFYYRGYINPPKDYEKWADLIRNCVQHWKEKYGLEEIKKWRFEVWNEPNLGGFWGGSKEEYFKTYDYAVEAVKSVDKELKVGGPATAGLGDWVGDLIEHCKTKNYATGGTSAPLDFISTHGYPWDKNKYYDRDRDMLYPNGKYFYYGIRELNNTVKYSGIAGIKEIHITEWGVFNYDTVDAGPYVCHILKDVEGFVDSFAFWTFSDVFEEGGPTQSREFPGIYGLLTVNGLRKSSYNTYLMLKMLGDKKLEVNLTRPDVPEIEAWASSKAKDSSVQVLVWNWKHPENRNQVSRKVKLKVRNISFKNAQMKHYRVDSANSDIYSYWKSIGSPDRINENQKKDMMRKSELTLIEKKNVTLKNGSFDAELTFPVSSVSLIILEKI